MALALNQLILYNTHLLRVNFKEILAGTDIEINKLFNTHGAKYRELGLKDKINDLTDDEN